MILDHLFWPVVLIAWGVLAVSPLRGEARRARLDIDASGAYGPADLRFTWWALWWAAGLVLALVAWASGVSAMAGSVGLVSYVGGSLALGRVLRATVRRH